MNRRDFAFLAAVLALTGCAHGVSVNRYSKEQFPPTASVEVFHLSPQGRPYVELAKLSTLPDIWHDSETKLIEKAKSLGADALIFVPSDNTRQVLVPVGNMMVARGRGDITAIAVKWTK